MHKTDGFPSSLAGKEFACNAGDPGLIPGSERSTGDGIGYPFQYSWASLVTQLVEYLQCGTHGFDPWIRKSPGEGNSYPLQYSGLENSMVHGVTESQTRLMDPGDSVNECDRSTGFFRFNGND